MHQLILPKRQLQQKKFNEDARNVQVRRVVQNSTEIILHEDKVFQVQNICQ